jgi:hypothetical protein
MQMTPRLMKMTHFLMTTLQLMILFYIAFLALQWTAQLIDNVSAEAILKASRSLTNIDLSPSILTVNSIGANSELQSGSLLQGGAINVSISASIGSAADEMNDVISYA